MVKSEENNAGEKQIIKGATKHTSTCTHTHTSTHKYASEAEKKGQSNIVVVILQCT